MVPCVSCATDSPTSVDSVNIEFTSRWLKRRQRVGERGIQVQRLGVHRQRGEQDVVGLGDGAAGPVLVAHTRLELLEPQTALDDHPLSSQARLARDQHQLHLRRALADLEDLAVAVVPRHRDTRS